MPKNNEIKYFEQSFKLPNPGLRSYFDIVRRGQPDEYRTTFAKGSSVQQVLSDWEPNLLTISDKWPTLVEFENDLRKKVGPLSIMKPLKDRMKDIDSYYDSILLEAGPLTDRAIKAVVDEFDSVRGISLRSWDRTTSLMKKSTNSGSPFFTKRRWVLGDTRPGDIAIIGNAVLQNLQGGAKHYNAAAVLGWRGQEGGPEVDNVKQRVVWMFPFAVNVKELQFYQPFIEACQNFDLVPAWVSMDSVDRHVTRMFDTKGSEDLVVCTDFSKFDQHFNWAMQDAAIEIIAHILANGEAEKAWLDEVFPVKFMIPLAYDYGKVRFGPHGMGSGSGGTNADETLAHRALQYEAAQRAGKRLNLHSQCLGDDGILTYPGITVDDVVRSYTAHGLEMNPDKQYASKQDCVYLRRWHHKDYRIDGVCAGVYSTYRALGRLCEQERYYDPEVWSAKMVALRQLSIIENVKYHPLREQFADFCMKRDRYRLGIDIPGFLDNISAIATQANELMPDFLGYTKSQQKASSRVSGIADWWIVKYLKSK